MGEVGVVLTGIAQGAEPEHQDLEHGHIMEVYLNAHEDSYHASETLGNLVELGYVRWHVLIEARHSAPDHERQESLYEITYTHYEAVTDGR